MTHNLEWLSKLNRASKGIWGIEYPHGASLDPNCILKASPKNCEGEVVHIVNANGNIQFGDNGQGIFESDFQIIVERVLAAAAENHRTSVTIVIMDFHNANVDEQCAIMKKARSIHETPRSLSLKFVFCGRWSYYAFCAAWKTNPKYNSHSPPIDSKDTLHVPPLVPDDVLKLLGEQRLVELYPSDIDLVAADFLVEQTGGDEFLISQAGEYLEDQRGSLTSDIEQVLNQLVPNQIVSDEITERINSLEPQSKSELIKLLRVQRLVRKFDSIESEQLWLAGLVQYKDLGGGKQCIQISSPLINKVIRGILESKKTGCIVPPDFLCFESEVISKAAYPKIAQIENTLRNLIVSEWYTEMGDKWSEKLRKIKDKPRELEQKEELRETIRSEIKAMGLVSESTEVKPTTSDGSFMRPPKPTILENALKLQKNKRDTHAFELSDDSLMHFLTTDNLANVLEHKEYGLCGKDKPFNRELLMAALDEFIEIRSAVAHNQPLKLSTISRLNDLHRKFVDWLTVFADQIVIFQDPPINGNKRT